MLKKLLLATTALFTLFVAPAQAGPLVGGIGALIGGIAGSGLSIGGLALGIFSMGAQWLISMLLAPEVEQKGVKTKMDTGGDNPPSFILGEYCTAGQLVYANVWDKSGYNIENACLVYVVQLSCKPVNALSNVVFANNERVTINPGTNWNGFWEVTEYVKGASGGGYFLVKFHDGTQGSSDPWLMDKFGSDPDRPWKNDMIGEGCAYVIIQAWYSNRGIWTGLPDLRWVVQGSSLYDPRKDSTVGGSGLQRWNNPNTWTFTKNPKVVEFNTIRGIRQSGEHLWGGTAEAYRLPLDYWFAAMNACDENVGKTGGGSVKRFEIGCEIHLDDKPIDIIAEINKSCNGYTTEYGGTYKTWVGGPGLPVGTITDDDFLITAEMETNKFQSQQSTYNTAYATYPEPKQQWEPKDGPRFQDDDALEEDGEELAIDISLPFVSENNQVQRVMRAAVKDSRRQITHGGELPPKAWVYEPFDVLAYQSGMFGYSGDGKDFMIALKDDLPNVNQRVLLREVDISDTGWLPEYEQAFDTAPLVIVTPGTMQAGFTVFPDQVDTTTGKDKPAIRAEWAWFGPEIDVRKVDWQIRYPSTTKVISEGSINDARGGVAIIESDVLRFGKTYEIQLRAVPYAVRDSDWTAWKSVTCVIVAVPTAPSLTRVSKLGTDGKLSYFVDVAWSLVAQEATYSVKVIIDGQTVVYPAATSPLRIPVAAGAVLTVSVAAVGADGTVGSYSSTAAITITKKNTAPTAPTSLTATGKIGRVVLKTTKNPDSDFDHWNLYGSSTNDFTTAVIIDDPRGREFVEGDLGNLATRYYWLTAVDSSGNESSKFPVSNTGGRVATTAKVGAADLAAGAVTIAATDQTVLAAPTGIALVQANKDVDLDGSVDIALLASFSGAVTGAIDYEFELSRSATSGGTYTVIETKSSPTGKVWFQANTAFFFKLRVRSINWDGTPGTWSSLVGPVQPLPKLVNTDGATAFAASSDFAGQIYVEWPSRAGIKDHDYTKVYLSDDNDFSHAFLIASVAAVNQVYVPYQPGATCFLWIAHVDTSGNESAKDPASNTGGVPVTIAKIVADEIQSGAVQVWDWVSPSGNQTIGAGNTATVITSNPIGVEAGVPVEINIRFGNGSGAARAVDVAIREVFGPPINTSIVKETIPSVYLSDDQVQTISHMYTPTVSGVAYYEIRITAGGSSFTANRRHLSVKAQQQ